MAGDAAVSAKVVEQPVERVVRAKAAQVKVDPVVAPKVAAGEIVGVRVESAPSPSPAAGLGFGLFDLVGVRPAVAVFVVLAALVGVGQDAVGLIYLLELFFGAGVARVNVGMVLAGQFPVGLTDILVGSVPGHSQQFIVV